MGTNCPLFDDPEFLLDRRGFLSRSAALGVLAALAGSCTPPNLGPDYNLPSPVTVSLADYPALASADGVVRVRETSVPIVLVNLGADNFVALSLVCPHQGGQIQWWANVNEFQCNVHGATFAEDGHWIGGQPTGSMRQYVTTYDAAAGTVTISP